MTVMVYQLGDRATRDQRADAMTGFSGDHAGLCAALFAAGLYSAVACVHADCLETAYRRTNSVDLPWYAQPQSAGLTVAPAARGGCRSTSVGDVLQRADGSLHAVSSFGFTEISDAAQFLNDGVFPWCQAEYSALLAALPPEEAEVLRAAGDRQPHPYTARAADREARRIIEASDEEILQEVRGEGLDPEVEADRVREIIRSAADGSL